MQTHMHVYTNINEYLYLYLGKLELNMNVWKYTNTKKNGPQRMILFFANLRCFNFKWEYILFLNVKTLNLLEGMSIFKWNF